MTIKYRELMNEYKVTLESDVLDPAFVTKANDFEAKVAANELTDDEIATADNELVELFNSLHEFAQVDSEEVIAARHGEAVANAKIRVTETADLEGLKKLRDEFKDLPEVLVIVNEKIIKLEDKARADEDKEKADILAAAKQEIVNCPYDQLQAMGEKYKANPELIEIIKDRHEKEKPKQTTIADKLRTKRQWSFAELAALGINVTGNNMEIEGVKLDKEYLFDVYLVRK